MSATAKHADAVNRLLTTWHEAGLTFRDGDGTRALLAVEVLRPDLIAAMRNPAQNPSHE